MRTAGRRTDSRPPEGEQQRARRRPNKLVLSAAATVLVVAASFLYLSRGPSEVSVDKAVEQFRAAETVADQPSQDAPRDDAKTVDEAPEAASRESSAQAAPTVPEGKATSAKKSGALPYPVPGVWVYDTDGYEETDALAGQRHDYPEETTMTIRHEGCGWSNRWQPLEERWEETEFCEDAKGSRLKRYTMYHEFFQRGAREEFDCEGYVYKKDAKPGDSWRTTCSSPQTKVDMKVTFVRVEELDIGGTKVASKRMHYDVTTTGGNRGKMIQERWLADDPRSMLKMTQDAKLDVDSPFGAVGYTEKYTVELASLEPRT